LKTSSNNKKTQTVHAKYYVKQVCGHNSVLKQTRAEAADSANKLPFLMFKKVKFQSPDY